jgi:hypothetical protein
MIDRCPICKARLKDATICPRCSTDLTLPVQIAKQADWFLKRAMAALAEGHLKRARQRVKQVIFLKPTPLARTLLNFIRQRLEKESQVPNEEVKTGTNEVPQVIVLGYEP